MSKTVVPMRWPAPSVMAPTAVQAAARTWPHSPGAELAGQQPGDQDGAAGGQGGREPEQPQLVGQRRHGVRQQGDQRRLVDVPPGGVRADDDEVELVAVVAVADSAATLSSTTSARLSATSSRHATAHPSGTRPHAVILTRVPARGRCRSRRAVRWRRGRGRRRARPGCRSGAARRGPRRGASSRCGRSRSASATTRAEVPAYHGSTSTTSGIGLGAGDRGQRGGVEGAHGRGVEHADVTVGGGGQHRVEHRARAPRRSRPRPRRTTCSRPSAGKVASLTCSTTRT